MTTNAADAQLEQIPVARIQKNPENPRLYFRPREMEELLESIHRYGVQVPISVYKSGKNYVLLDGERRWRCALKLNMKTIPGLIQDQPTRLNNMLLMFNIHALREQWDLLTIALKLKEVIDLLHHELGRRPKEAEIALRTGLSRAVIRRCAYLLGLPEEYREMVLEELKKPKQQQRLTEDFFIEMERALTTVERAMPDVLPAKDRVRKVLIKKFRDDVIDNRVHFRLLGKMARVGNVGGSINKARTAINRVFDPNNNYSITKAYEESVAGAYQERDTLTRVDGTVDHLSALQPNEIDDDIRRALRALLKQVRRLLGA
jgi:ParB family transcriptional regulator, chromosome partitioning protein